MMCSRLDFDGIALVDRFDFADRFMLVEIDDDIVGFDICSRLE